MTHLLVKRILLTILILSAILRVGWLARGDTVNDEVFYGFRAVGMLDFDEANQQTTPLEWFDPAPPWWTKFSFHDHPPLVFFIQHISIALFGENNFAMRFPSALLGVATVYLTFLLGRLLLSPAAGLIAAGLLSVTLNHIYISRVGMQEAFLIFFLLLASYLFLRSIRNGRSLITTGVVIGLALLTKYNAFILFPIFGTYLFLFHREYFRKRNLWFAVLTAVFIFSPVIVYNLMLYRVVGHFDFQFSYVFGQTPEAWQVAPGKDIGTFTDRARDFFPRLIGSNSWVFLMLVAISLFFLRNPFLWLVLGYLLLLLSVIGPSFRFLTMLTPFLTLSVGAFLARQVDMRRYILAFLIPVVAFEIFYSVNNQIMYYPKGQSPWLSSKVRYENYNWGNNELGEFFRREFMRKVPAVTFEMKYRFLEEIQDTSIASGQKKGYRPYPALVVTEGNFNRGAKLWVLDRLHIYHGWPIIDFLTYRKYLSERGNDYYKRVGFTHYYFVESVNRVPDPAFSALVRDVSSISIRNPRGDEAFRIYFRESADRNEEERP